MKGKKITNLSISLAYTDTDGTSWSFRDLSMDNGFIAPEHLNLEAFYEVDGKIEIAKDRIFKFVDIADTEDLTFPVFFLLYSLYNLLGVEDQLLPTFENQVVSKMFLINQDYLELRIISESTLELNYRDKNDKVPIFRNSPYFENFLLDKEIWIKEAFQALSEYFILVDKIRALDKTDSSVFGAMSRYWQVLQTFSMVI